MINSKSGYLIIYVIVLTFITMAIGLSVLSVSSTQYTHVVDDVYRQDATYGAKACASIIAEKLSANPSATAFSEQTIFDDLNNSQGRVTCSATVANGSSGTKNVNITTTMRRFAADPRPIEYKMRAVMKSEGVEFSGSTDYLRSDIFAGYGGFYTTTYSLAYLKGTNLYSLGKIYSGNASNSLGSSSNPFSTITVANMGCGDATTWPQQCTDQPIQTWTGSSTLPYIYGSLCAPGQNSSTRFRSPGLQSGCTVPARTPPHFDKKTFVSNMTNTMSAADIMSVGTGKCLRKSGSLYYGNTVRVPANTRINGSLDRYYEGATDITTSSNLQSRCILIFDGPAYVTGAIGRNIDLDVDSNATQNITVVVNGKVGFRDGSNIRKSSYNKLLKIISFYSPSSSCSNSDSIPSATVTSCLTPQQARQAAQVNPSGPATDSAFDVDLVEGSIYIPGVTFYAYYGAVYMGCAVVTISAIGGQSVSNICTSTRFPDGTGLLTADNLYGGDLSNGFGDLTPGPLPEYKIVDISRQ